MSTVRRGLMIGMFLAAATAAQAQAQPVVLENETLRWEIGPDGVNRHFTDKTGEQDYLKTAPPVRGGPR